MREDNDMGDETAPRTFTYWKSARWTTSELIGLLDETYHFSDIESLSVRRGGDGWVIEVTTVYCEDGEQ